MSLIKMVLDGKKPGAFVDLDEELDERLSVKPSGHWSDGKINKPNQLAISLKGNRVSNVLDYLHLNVYSVIGMEERLLPLYDDIKNMEICDALVYLNEYPREDVEYESVEAVNLELPEVAILEGELLGYRACDVIYYIKKNYIDGRGHSLDYIYPEENPHILCYECAKEHMIGKGS